MVVLTDSVAEWIGVVDLETMKCRAGRYQVRTLVPAVVGRFFIRGEILRVFPPEAVHKN
jgi:hypothetical protein